MKSKRRNKKSASKTRAAVLVSGSGTNLQALIDAFKIRVEDGGSRVKGKTLPPKSYPNPAVEIALVLSSDPGAYALTRAQKAGIETLVLENHGYKSRLDYAKDLVRELRKRRINLVCLAGFMAILNPYFIRKFRNRILNVHPALLPAFGGKGMYGHHVHEAVIKSGAKFSGCTVHFVDEGCDTGAIILQESVRVQDADTPEKLAARILKFEHRIYPQAVKLFAEGRLKIKGKRVVIEGRI